MTLDEGRRPGRAPADRAPTRSGRPSSRCRAPDGTGATTLSHLARPDRRRSPPAEHADRRPLAAGRGRRPDRRRDSGRRSGSPTRTTASTGRPRPATSSGSTGTRARRRSAGGRSRSARTAFARPRTCSASPRSKPIDFYIYADQQAFYDALGPGDARERRRRGGRRHPDAVRAHPAEPRSTTPGSASSIPHELTHLVFDTAAEQPVPLPAALAQRGPRGLPEPGLRRVRPGTRSQAAVRPGRSSRSTASSASSRRAPTGSTWPTPRASRRSTSWSGPTARTRSSRSSARTPTGAPTTRRSSGALGVDTAAFGAAWLADLGAGAAGAVRAAAGARRAGPVRLAGRRRRDRPGRERRSAVASAGATAAPRRPGRRPPAAAARMRPPVVVVALIVVIGLGLLVLLVARRGRRRTAGDRSRDRSSWLRTHPELAGHPRARRCSALGFLIAAQLASEGPRVRYTTQERTPLLETAAELQAQQDDLQGPDPRAARPDPGGRGPGRRARPTSSASSTTELEQARIAAGLIPLTGTGIVLQLEDSQAAGPARRQRRPTTSSGRATSGRSSRSSGWPGAEAIAVNGERVTPTTAIIDIGALAPRQLGVPRAAVPGDGARPGRPLRPAEPRRPGSSTSSGRAPRATASASRSPSRDVGRRAGVRRARSRCATRARSPRRRPRRAGAVAGEPGG